MATSTGAFLRLPDKQRTMLALLLLRANRVVPTESLIEAMWDARPPQTARVSVQGHVKALRRALGDLAKERLVTREPGYLVRVSDGELDLHRFVGLRDRARLAAAEERWEEAAGQLRQALDLWRGEPLADVPSSLLRRQELPMLAEEHLQVLEMLMDADLRLGRHAQLVAGLRELAAAHPLRERFQAQLILALHRCGEQAEAIDAYRRIQALLARELGIDPGLELQGAYQRILTPGRAAPASHPPVPPPWRSSRQLAPQPGAVGTRGSPAPQRQLPADVGDFTGRAAQVGQLCGFLARDSHARRPGARAICAVVGPGGMGKTALAIHVAHQLAREYPDGQLHANLQGATGPADPADVLARFLRDLGVPDSAIPSDEAERAVRYRDLFNGRRILVVLDDARDAAQVRSLLPGSASCAVIVTSRRGMAHLPGAYQHRLDVLGPDDARALFTRIVGSERGSAEPAAMELVLEYCAGLPLAIRIAASRLASRPAWSVALLAARLSDECRRLSELAVGDVAVRASIAMSYQALSEGAVQAAALFRLLGLAGTETISLSAAAVLADESEDDVGQALAVLMDSHCLEDDGQHRYRMHDLVRIYAAELAAKHGSPGQNLSAMRRLLEWYRQRVVVSGLWHGSEYGPPGADLMQAFSSGPEALAWCEAERASLVAATRRAAELGMPGVAAQIAAGLGWFFQRMPYLGEWQATHEIGLECARLAGDAYTEAWLLNSLAKLHCRSARFDDAHSCLKAGLAIWRRTGRREGEAMVLNTLGASCLAAGQPGAAIDYLRQGLTISTELGKSTHMAIICNNLGEGFRQLKSYDEAFTTLRRARALFQEAGDRYGEAIAETTLGEAYADLGEHEVAIAHHERALTASDDPGAEVIDRAVTLRSLAQSYSSLGRAAEARNAWLAAIAILDRFGDPAASEIRHRIAASPDR